MKTVAIYTLGCKVNQYESQALAEILQENGIRLQKDGADACIINTCTVTGESDRKCRQTIRRAIRENPGSFTVVMGCLSQVDPTAVSAIDGVDAIFGNREKKAAAEAILHYFREKEREADAAALWKPKEPMMCVSSLEGAPFEPMSICHSERTRAYIKVEDGCESHCAYCIIPKARGKIRSKPLSDVVKEAEGLIQRGYKELVLTGIEVSAYGSDIPGTDLASLVEALGKLPGIARIRFPSIDPSCMKPVFADRIAKCSNLAPHFHLSLQSACNKTLFAMRRKYNTEMVKAYMAHLRELLPDVEFTADIIVGFPGETEEDFEQTYRCIDELNLLDAHIFAYSKRPGTEAAAMPDQIPEEIKHRRSERLIALCQAKKSRRLLSYAATHKEAEVLFETFDGQRLVGRLGNYMEIEVDSDTDLRGQIRTVTLLPLSESATRLQGKLSKSS